MDVPKKILLLFISLILSVAAFTQNKTSRRVLFVGNSYTYFWNLPQSVAVMAESEGILLKTSQSTAGGTNWGQHLRGEKALKTVEVLNEQEFDIVILQNHSMSTLERPDSMFIFGRQLAQMAREAGAEVYLYMTWSREWDPYMQETIARKYLELGNVLGAKIVPVGLAWQKALNLRPDLPLYHFDGSHPSPMGTYLTACVFFGMITGKSPVGLPARLLMTDGNGEKLYLNIQSPNDALFCQKVAEDIINNWSK